MLDELIDLLGFETAMRLVALRGGSELYIPHDRTTGWIAQEFGVEVLQKLAERYGGTHLWVPKGDYHRSCVSRAIVLKLRRQGLTIRRLADQFSLTHRRIYQILASEEERSGVEQLTLF